MKLLHDSRRRRVEDAVFMGAYAQLVREQVLGELMQDPRLLQATKNELDAVSIICRELSCSRRVARYLIDRKITLENLVKKGMK